MSASPAAAGVDILKLSLHHFPCYLPALKYRRADDADRTKCYSMMVPRLIEFGNSDLRNARNLPSALFSDIACCMLLLL